MINWTSEPGYRRFYSWGLGKQTNNFWFHLHRFQAVWEVTTAADCNTSVSILNAVVKMSNKPHLKFVSECGINFKDWGKENQQPSKRAGENHVKQPMLKDSNSQEKTKPIAPGIALYLQRYPMEVFAQDLVKDLICLKNKTVMKHERESGSVPRIHFCAHQTNSFHLTCSLKLSRATGEPDTRIPTPAGRTRF